MFNFRLDSDYIIRFLCISHSLTCARSHVMLQGLDLQLLHTLLLFIFFFYNPQESDSPSNSAIHLHPLTLASVHSVIQMAADPRAAPPTGFIHNAPQVCFCIFTSIFHLRPRPNLSPANSFALCPFHVVLLFRFSWLFQNV